MNRLAQQAQAVAAFSRRLCIGAEATGRPQRVSKKHQAKPRAPGYQCVRLIVERVLMKNTDVAAALMSVILDRKQNSRFALICTMNYFELSKQASPRR